MACGRCCPRFGSPINSRHSQGNLQPRTVSHVDLAEDEIAAALEMVNAGGRFVALFCMYGTKIGATTNRGGID